MVLCIYLSLLISMDMNKNMLIVLKRVNEYRKQIVILVLIVFKNTVNTIIVLIE